MQKLKRILVTVILNVGFVALLPAQVASADAHVWQNITRDNFVVYPAAAVTGANGNVYVMGGSFAIGEDAADLMDMYNFQTNAWAGMKPMSQKRGDLAAAAGSNGLIYVFGGNYQGNVSATAEVYDPLSDSWTDISSMPVSRRHARAVGTNNGKVLVFGGFNANSQAITRVDEYDIATNTWAYVSDMPSLRHGFALTVGTDSKIYAFGGASGNDVLNTVDVYNPASNSWTVGPTMPTAKFESAASIGPDGKIYVMGGYSSINVKSSSVEALDTSSNQWESAPSLPSASSELVASTAGNGRIVAVRGELAATFGPHYDVPDQWFGAFGDCTSNYNSVTVSIRPTLDNLGSPVTSYKIYRGTYYVPQRLIATVDASDTTYIDSTVPPGVDVVYQVAAVNSIGQSQYDNTLFCGLYRAPDAPNNYLSRPGPGIGTIQILWSKPYYSFDNKPLLHYNLYRGTSTQNLVKVAEIAQPTPETVSFDYIDGTGAGSPLLPNSTYYYQITAVNEIGESPRTNIMSSKANYPPICPPVLGCL